MQLFSIFSKDKSFSLPIIGNPFLNRIGLHIWRIRLADIILKLRRIQVCGLNQPNEYRSFKKDGIVILEDFLPENEFQSLASEVKLTMSKVDKQQPIQNYGDHGFGKKHAFDWGFDRYDGDTLNRFYNITNTQTSAQTFINNPRLKKITSYFSGTYHDKTKYDLYKLHHGSENQNSDSQKIIHRDTFHSSIKLWYFLDNVEKKHGPFNYAVGTHKMSKNRLQWEKSQSIRASKENTGGAFRITKSELDTLGDGQLQSFPVKANTLVIADIRGFHCRGSAQEHQDRISIYANIRPSPYLPAYHSGNLKSLAKRLNLMK